MRQIKISYNITNRDSEGLEKYLVDISREPMVSVEEETELAHKISLGGQSVYAQFCGNGSERCESQRGGTSVDGSAQFVE